MKTIKIKMKNTKKIEIKNQRFTYLTMQWLKLKFSELKRKIKFINNKDDIRNFFLQKVFYFLLSKRFYILYIYL